VRVGSAIALVIFVTLDGLAACAARTSMPDRPGESRAWEDARDEVADPGEEAQAESRGNDEGPTLPEGLVPGRFENVTLDGERLRIVHAAAHVERALIYLHGMCGNIEAPAEWAEVVHRYATLIALGADVACDPPGRFKWGLNVHRLHERILAAAASVARLRGGHLDTERMVVMGYSQGATRAAMLTEAHPDRYPWVIAGGIPSKPRVNRIGKAARIAIVGGELEPLEHMHAGVDDLRAAGRTVRFFLLPGAAHGQYGAEGPRVLDAVFRFVLDSERASRGRSPSPKG
jgi:predicted esterase